MFIFTLQHTGTHTATQCNTLLFLSPRVGSRETQLTAAPRPQPSNTLQHTAKCTATHYLFWVLELVRERHNWLLCRCQSLLQLCVPTPARDIEFVTLNSCYFDEACELIWVRADICTHICMYFHMCTSFVTLSSWDLDTFWAFEFASRKELVLSWWYWDVDIRAKICVYIHIYVYVVGEMKFVRSVWRMWVREKEMPRFELVILRCCSTVLIVWHWVREILRKFDFIWVRADICAEICFIHIYIAFVTWSSWDINAEFIWVREKALNCFELVRLRCCSTILSCCSTMLSSWHWVCEILMAHFEFIRVREKCKWLVLSWWYWNVAVCCSMLRCVAVVSLCMRSVAVCCSVLLCVAACCSVLQGMSVCCSGRIYRRPTWQCVTVCCIVLQYVAVCCSALLCVAAASFVGALHDSVW